MDKVVNGGAVPWAGMFCGRERELEALMATYRRVEAGDGPEVAVVLGESGLGKTRLVQEFYARLSTSIDAEGECGYWPDRMVRDGNNLKVNPDPAECNPSQIANMRFLWWGIRMLDRTGHNAGMGGLSEAVPLLRPHLEPFAKAKLLGARMKQAATGAAMDIAVEVANLFTFGLIGLGKLGVDHAREWKSIRDAHGALAGFDVAAEHDRQRDNLIDIVLNDLGTLFRCAEEKGEPLPAIILLDDTQWLSGDDITQSFIARLLSRAGAEAWPLLFIATHWEKEWHEDAESDDGRSFASLARQFDRDDWKPLILGKEPNLAGMIRAGFPGLSQAQIDLLIEKADGNPRLLDEILRHLQVSRGLFEGRDLANKLTTKGEEATRIRTFDLHSLVAERLSQAPDEVQVAVALSGYQGMQFLSRITAAATARIGGEDYADGLGAAERPYSLVATLEHGLAEFSQRVFYEVAKERLPHVVGEEEAVEAIRSVLRDLAGEMARFDTLGDEERKAALELGARVMWDPETDKIDTEDWELAHWCKARLADTSAMTYGNLLNRWAVIEACAKHEFGLLADHEGRQLINRIICTEHGWDFAKNLMADAIKYARRDFELEPTTENRHWLNKALDDAVTSELFDRDGYSILLEDGKLKRRKVNSEATFLSRIEEGLALTEGCETQDLTFSHLRWLHILRDNLGKDEIDQKIDIQCRILELVEEHGALGSIAGDWGRRLTMAEFDLGVMCSNVGRFEESTRYLEKALENIREIDRIDGEISPNMERQALSYLMYDLPEIGRAADARRFAEELEAFTRQQCGEICSGVSPANIHSRGCKLPSDLSQVAEVLFHDGDVERARTLLAEVRDEITDDQGNLLMWESRNGVSRPRFEFELEMIERSLAAWEKDKTQ